MKLIPLTQDKFATVDDEDYEKLSAYRWRYDNGYAKCGHSRYNDMWRMHEMILGQPTYGKVWDHIDQDGTNNQKSNLRLASRSQNGINRDILKNNTLGFKGIKRQVYKGKIKYSARITKDGTSYSLGCYLTKEEAALAYNKKAIEFFGEFAKLNIV